MKKFWKEESENWRNSPVAYWVHIEQDGNPFYKSQEFDPPAPKKNLNGLYNIYNVEFNGYVFNFSSIHQYRHFIDIISQKILPRSIDLSKQRTGNYGPNGHWLSRLPAKTKSWKYRSALVEYLLKIEDELFQE